MNDDDITEDSFPNKVYYNSRHHDNMKDLNVYWINEDDKLWDDKLNFKESKNEYYSKPSNAGGYQTNYHNPKYNNYKSEFNQDSVHFNQQRFQKRY